MRVQSVRAERNFWCFRFNIHLSLTLLDSCEFLFCGCEWVLAEKEITSVCNLVGLKTMERSGKSTKVMLRIYGGGVQGIKRVLAPVHLWLFVFLFPCPEGFLLFLQAGPAVLLSLYCRSHGIQLACWLCSERSFALSWNMTVYYKVQTSWSRSAFFLMASGGSGCKKRSDWM